MRSDREVGGGTGVVVGAEVTTADTAAGPRSRLLPGARRTESGELVRTAARGPEHSRTWSWLVLGGLVAAGLVGAVLVALAVRLGAEGSSAAGVLTWVGLGVAVLPAAGVALARDTTAAARWTALAVTAVVTVVPVGLRSGAGPATTDDLARYAQLAALRRGAPLLPDRLPAVVADQPGLAALTTAVWRVSGLTVWHSALVVVVVVHVAAVVGARALVRGLGLGERVAVLAAVLWSLGPAVLVATSRVGGGALGLALLLWAVAAVVQAATAAGPGRRTAWTATAVGLAAATAVTDLAAAWTLVGLTLLVGAVTIGLTAPPVSGAAVRRAWWPAAAGVTLVTVAWSVLPAGRAVLGDLAGLGAEHHRDWSTGPGEVALGVAAVAVGLALAGVGAFRVRGRFTETGPRLGLAVAALFPLSLLGSATPATSTLAVVLWPVLAAGLAPFVAAGLLALWDLGARRTRSAAPERSVSGALRHVQRDTRAAEVARPETTRPATPARPAPARPAPARPAPARPVEAAARDRRLPLPVAATAALLATALVLLGASVATAPSAADPAGARIASGTVPTTSLLTLGDRLTELAGPGFRFAASDPQFGAVLAAATGAVQVTEVGGGDDVFGTDPTGATADALRAARVDWLVDLATGGHDALARTPWLVRVLSTPSVTVYRVRPAVPGAAAGTDTPATRGVVPAGGS